MDEKTSACELSTLALRCGIHIFRRASWSEDELRHLIQGVEDLARLMGGAAKFRRELGRVFLWRAPFRTSMAAMAAPLLDVVYFEGASWGDPPEFLWQTVHELAHVWAVSYTHLTLPTILLV